MSTVLKSNEAVELFYSYSHKDEELRDEIDKHLSILQRQGLIRGWYDRRIGAGETWKGQIDAHLETANIILLLVSSDFLASNYCYDIEMKHAMQRHESGEALVIPIILRPVDWKMAPFGKLQALPKDGKPVVNWRPRDKAFENVAIGIREAIQTMKEQREINTNSKAGKPQGDRVQRLGTRAISPETNPYNSRSDDI